jgi:hypothetical protein
VVIAEAKVETHFTSITSSMVKSMMAFEEPRHINRVIFVSEGLGIGLGRSFGDLCKLSGVPSDPEGEN